jgi:ketosteroid isomerase-like protein
MRVILMAGMLISSSPLVAQSKGEMLFTSSSPEAKKLLRQAWVSYADAKLDEASGYVRQALEKDPEFGMAHAFIHTDDKSARDENLKRAAGCPLSSDEKLLIDGLRALQAQESTLDYFEPLLTKYPKDYYLNLWIMFRSKDAKRSKEIGEMIVKRNPKFAPAYNLLGYHYMVQNDFKNAEANFNKYMSLRPDLANVYDSKADYLMRVGKIEEAIPLFEKSSELGMAPSKGRAEIAKAKLKYPGPSHEDVQEIKNLISDFSAGAMNGDTVMKYRSNQSMEIFPNQMVNVGIDNIRNRMADTFKYGSFTNLDISVESVQGTGPIALAWGNTKGSFKPASTEEINENTGRDIFLFRKQDNGQWRMLVHHWIITEKEGPNDLPSSGDISAIREVINSWNSFVKTGEVLSEKHIDNLEALHSSQAVEIYPNQRSNIGIANLRTRWAGFAGVTWAGFTGISFDTYSVATVGSEGSSRRAIAWGIGDHSFYPKGSSELYRFLFPWAMILTKEKDDKWRILVYHWFLG